MATFMPIPKVRESYSKTFELILEGLKALGD